ADASPEDDTTARPDRLDVAQRGEVAVAVELRRDTAEEADATGDPQPVGERRAWIGDDDGATRLHPTGHCRARGIVHLIGQHERGGVLGVGGAAHDPHGHAELAQRIDDAAGSVGVGRAWIERLAGAAVGTDDQRDGDRAHRDRDPGQPAPPPHVRAPVRTRSAREPKRAAAAASVSPWPYQASSNSSVAPAKSAAASGAAPATSRRYSPAVRPGTSSTSPRSASSATRARYRQRTAPRQSPSRSRPSVSARHSAAVRRAIPVATIRSAPSAVMPRPTRTLTTITAASRSAKSATPMTVGPRSASARSRATK